MIYQKFKRCLSFALALLLVVSLMPVSALGAETDETTAEETAATQPADTTTLETEATEEPSAPAEPEISDAALALQARIDTLLALYGIEGTMTDEEITNAIFLADGDTIYKTMTEREAIEADAMVLSMEELLTLDLALYERFWHFFDMIFYPVPAVTVTGTGGVEVTVDSNGSVSESGGTVTATVKGSFTTRKTTTITVKNTSGSTATISFDYTVSNHDSSVSTIDDLAGSNSGSYSVLLTAGATKTFTMCSQRFTSNLTATAKLSNFKVEAAAASSNVTVSYTNLGSVKKDGTTVTNGDKYSISSATGATFVATPSSGAKFIAWINPDNGAVITKNATYKLVPTEDTKLKAVFTNAASSPWFWCNEESILLEGMAAALAHVANASNKVFTLASDATLPSGNYTIPAGVTLLIPYDATGTLCTDKPSEHENAYTAPSVFRTLTMADGANITVNGAISISGSISSKYGNNGMPSGPYGKINMNSGSKITVNGSAKLYAWGYITGAGSVEINNGGHVYECFQVADYRGGDATTQIVGKDDEYGVFPFNQYYVQNVEVPMTLHAGATETGYGAVYVTLAGHQPMSIPFIGNVENQSMFVISSGYIIKDYMEGTGRTKMGIYGDLKVTKVNVDIKVSLIGDISIDSSKYALPIPQHFNISLESGSVTMNQNVAFFPGSELYIRERTTCTLGSGKKIYVYDLDQWLYNEGKNGYSGTTNLPYMQLKHVPGGDGTTGRLKDALIQIDGTVDASAGSVYVTSGGANIYSTGTGKVVVGSAPDTTVRQVITNDTDVGSWPEIPIVPAILQNAAGKDPASTNTAETTGTYVYRNGIWCPHTDTDYTDSDKNHKCDTCGTVMSACSDDNKDHKCDTCGMVMSQCSDVTSDGNHTCDICGADGITEHTMLNGVCTDCGAAYEAQIGSTYYETLAKALTQVAEGATVTLLTNISGEITISQQVSIELGNYSANIQAGEGFTYAKNGTVITIGKAVLGIGAVNLRAGDSLDLFFYVKKTALANSGYTDFYAKIERTKGGTVQPAETISYAQWEDYNETYVRFCYDGIAAKEMTDSVTVTVYSADGKPLSSAYTDSVQGYAMRMIRKGSSSAALKTALVDMLNYGAAAQTHFGFNTSSLANALIESEGYSSLATKETPVCTKITGNPDAFYAGSVSVKNNLTFTFCFSGIDPYKIATATYTDHYGKNKTPSGTFYTLTDENGVTVTNGGQTVYGVDIEDIAIADGRQKITCTVTDVSGNEIQAISSVKSYLAYAMEKYPDEDVFPMLAKFIDSAYAYFHQ